MKTLLAVTVFALCLIGGECFLEDVLIKVLKVLGKDCPKATDLKCPREDITFWLYTKNTQDNPTKLNQFQLDSLKDAPFVDGDLKFIVHGYSVDKDTAVNKVLRPAYFDKGEHNIISVDWSALGKGKPPCYYYAAVSVPTVAHCVAVFLNAVIKAKTFTSIQLLGHSMGAHVAAQASNEIPDLPRLTLFDVAFPMFDDDSKLLKKGAAKVVDVYHSNCDLKGRLSPDGAVDVYFNNGMFQPGCKCNTGCSHLRAVEFYAESIATPEKMMAFPCNSWKDFVDKKCPVPTAADLLRVGENIDTSKNSACSAVYCQHQIDDTEEKGTYMMFTEENPPFLVDPALYTNEASFRHFKDTASSDCKIGDLLSIIKDWISQ